MTWNKKNTFRLAVGLLAIALLAGCDNMREGNRMKPYETTPFFEDGSVARELPAGTVPRGFLREDTQLYQGKNDDGSLVNEFPSAVTAKTLARGRDRYNIYCIVCHGVTGAGDGMVVHRGYTKPISFQDKSVERSPGYLYDIISNGSGVMAPFNTELTPEDRWAVAAYVKALEKIDSGEEHA